MNSLFLLKLFLVPGLIGIITLVSRRWGPALAGWLSGFPVFAGPVLLLIAMEHGPSFAGVAADGALRGVLGNTMFCLGYAWAAANGLAWWLSLPLAFLAYAFGLSLIFVIDLPSWGQYLLTLIVLWFISRAMPSVRAQQRVLPPLCPELPVRMTASAIVVILITFLAASLGPEVSGVLSAMPLLATILASFSHSSLGAGAAVYLMRGMLGGFYALASFCFLLTIALPAWDDLSGFFISLAGALLAQLLSLRLQPSMRIPDIETTARETGASSDSKGCASCS